MAKQQPRARYTPEQDSIIKLLNGKDWSSYEVAYRIFQKTGEVRSTLAINQRKMRLMQDGSLKSRGPGKRFATKEALDWYNKQFKTEIGPAPMLELTEDKPRLRNGSNGTKKRRSKKTNGKANGHSLTSREIVGFTKSKGHNEERLDYTDLIVATKRTQPDALGLFADILRTGIDEERTAVDILRNVERAIA